MELSYEDENFIDAINDLKTQYLMLRRRCLIYEAALEAVDSWAVPEIETAEGSFMYIPYQIEGVADIFSQLADLLPDDPDYKHSSQPIRPLTLVEVGCGIGRNLNIARHQSEVPLAKTIGFDIVPEYIAEAKTLYNLGEDVFVQDAMTFDYSGYDLVMFYRPFSDDKLEAKFEEYLMDSVKAGAIIIGLNVERLDSSRKVVEVGDHGHFFKKL